MANLSIIPHDSDFKDLLGDWIEAERNGIEFPVPFDSAWKMAGYSNKSHGKRKLISKKSRLIEDRDYISKSGQSSLDGRSSDDIWLNCDAFKAFCLLAETDDGDAVRQYFIEAEKRWKLVVQIAPEVAQQVELVAMQMELERLKNQGKAIDREIVMSEERQLATRHWATTVAPKAIGDRVLGIKEIHTTEYRKTIVDQSGNVLNAGKTLNKGRLCQEFGFISRTGNPDYKAIKALIQEAIKHGAIVSPWREVTTLASLEFDALLLPTLKQYYESSPSKRQMWMGE
jgi:phage anti-repressor protein